MDDVTGTAAEPVRVGRLTETQTRAADAYEALRRELGGLVCRDQAEVDAFAHQVATRVGQYRLLGLADAILVALLIERLCGVSDAAVVTVPQGLLVERVAARS